jgi:hypothetical protein
MSDEYRRVLHQWARTLLPADIGDVPIVDVKLETSTGGSWSEWTHEDPEFTVTVFYYDAGTTQRYLADTGLEDGGIVMSKLLHELFRIAGTEEAR